MDKDTTPRPKVPRCGHCQGSHDTVAQARLPQGVERLIETVIALLAPALEGGTPPPPPYAPRRAFSRS